MLRQILNLFFRIGIIELLLAFFILANAITFALYIINIRRQINKGLLLFFTLACGGIGACLGMLFANRQTGKKVARLTILFGVIIALIPALHITHALTLDRIIRYVEIEFHSEN